MLITILSQKVKAVLPLQQAIEVDGQSCLKVGESRRRYDQSVQCCFFSFSSMYNKRAAEPWVDSQNALLRSDIERLSSVGIIKKPINTWPLM